MITRAWGISGNCGGLGWNGGMVCRVGTRNWCERLFFSFSFLINWRNGNEMVVQNLAWSRSVWDFYLFFIYINWLIHWFMCHTIICFCVGWANLIILIGQSWSLLARQLWSRRRRDLVIWLHHMSGWTIGRWCAWYRIQRMGVTGPQLDPWYILNQDIFQGQTGQTLPKREADLDNDA